MKRTALVFLALLGTLATGAQADQRKIDVVISNHHMAERQVRISGLRNFDMNDCFDSKKTHGVQRTDGKKKDGTLGRSEWRMYFKAPFVDWNQSRQCTDEDCVTVCVKLCDQKGECYDGGAGSAHQSEMCTSYKDAKNGSMLVIDSRGRGFDTKNSKGWTPGGLFRPNMSCGG